MQILLGIEATLGGKCDSSNLFEGPLAAFIDQARLFRLLGNVLGKDVRDGCILTVVLFHQDQQFYVPGQSSAIRKTNIAMVIR